MIEQSLLNVIFILLAFLAVAIVAVLALRWIRADPGKKPVARR